MNQIISEKLKNTNLQTPFGTYLPTETQRKTIAFCQKLPNRWWAKQLVQLLRKKLLKTAALPLDIELEGIRIRCFFTDNVSERSFVFMPWRYDFIERRCLIDCLPKDGVFVDIGANVGIYSCIAAKQLNERGTIVALEPNPRAFDRLVFNLQATLSTQPQKPQVKPLAIAVSDREESVPLYLSQHNMGASGLKKTPTKQQIQVQCQPLLTLLQSHQINRIDGLKVDIEGAEDLALYPFLKEAKQTLLPRLIILENNWQQWSYPLLKALEQKGYRRLAQTRNNLIYTAKQSDPLHSKEGKQDTFLSIT